MRQPKLNNNNLLYSLFMLSLLLCCVLTQKECHRRCASCDPYNSQLCTACNSLNEKTTDFETHPTGCKQNTLGLVWDILLRVFIGAFTLCLLAASVCLACGGLHYICQARKSTSDRKKLLERMSLINHIRDTQILEVSQRKSQPSPPPQEQYVSVRQTEHLP